MSDFLIALAFIYVIGVPILTIVLLIMVRNARRTLNESESRIQHLEEAYENLTKILAQHRKPSESEPPPAPEPKKEETVAEPKHVPIPTPPQPPPIPVI